MSPLSTPVITSVNVSEELEISDLVTFLELKEDVSEWADKILSYEGKEREDASEQIRSHGYDVQFTADTFTDVMTGRPAACASTPTIGNPS